MLGVFANLRPTYDVSARWKVLPLQKRGVCKLRKALQFVDAENLYPSSNCCMISLPRQVANGKLRALSAGAVIVRREILVK